MAKKTIGAKQGIKWSGALYRTVLDWAERCRQEISEQRTGEADDNDEATGDGAELEEQQYDRLLQVLRQDVPDGEYKPETRADVEEIVEKISTKLVCLAPEGHDLREHGMMVIDPTAMPKYVKDRFSKQELDQWKVSKKSYRRKRERVRKTQNPDRTRDGSQQHNPSKPTLDGDATLRLAARMAMPQPVDVETNMREIVRQIKNAVQGVLSGANVDGSQPVLVEYDSLGSDLKLLLQRVVGGRKSELQQRYREIRESQVQQRLPLDVFIRSLVGAAVTTWTLQTVPGISEPFKGMCESMYRHAKELSPDVATWIRHSALCDHLETSAGKPTKERARKLATDLDNILLPFFIGPSSDKNREIDSVEAVEERDAPIPADQLQSTDNLTGLNDAPPAWRMRWNFDLELIFQQAMLDRIDMAKARASYTVVLPQSGALFSATDMSRDDLSEEDPSEGRPRVFVALSPIITAWFLDSFEDTTQGKEAKVLAKSTIYAFDP